MEAIQSVLALVVTLGILVTIHEFGHFWVARKCGVKVLRFSVGFGKPLLSWYDKKGTEFAVAAIPLGGYVRMLDEREGPVPSDQIDQAFTSKTVWQRIAIASAGPLANFIFAICAYWAMFFVGFNVVIPKVGTVLPESPAAIAGVQEELVISAVDGQTVNSWRDVVMRLVNRIGDTGAVSLEASPSYQPEAPPTARFELSISAWMQNQQDADLLRALGLVPFRPAVEPLIDIVVEGGAAQQAGMLEGDKIISVDGEPVDDWYQLVDIVQRSAGQVLVLGVEREQALDLVTLNVIPQAHGSGGEQVGKIGVGVAPFTYPPELIATVNYGFVRSFVEASKQTWSDVAMTVGAIKKMVVGLISLENLSGPITIARVANQTISTGLEEFLRFLALLSVSLGVLNLLPVPVLDGGHILFYLIEAVRGKPLSQKSQEIGLKIGLSFVVLLMVVAFYNDIMRL